MKKQQKSRPRQLPNRPQIAQHRFQEATFSLLNLNIIFGSIFAPFWLPKCLPFGTLFAPQIYQELSGATSSPQDRSKTAQDRPKVAPRPPQDHLRSPQEAPKAFPRGLKRSPRGPKRDPRQPNTDPNRSQDTAMEKNNSKLQNAAWRNARSG